MKPINTAICSFGMSGWVFHAPFITTNPGFNFYGVWERTKNLAQEKYPGVKTFRTLEDMLADKNVELVIVNTPSVTHFEFAMQAILAGKHVIVEKPFTATVLQAEELIAAAKKKDVKLSVYHNRRYDSDYRTIKKVLESGSLGKIIEAEIHYDRYVPELSYKIHKETPTPGVGAVYDLGSHLIDQVLQLFGMPVAVFGDITINRPGSKVDDYFDIKLFYPTHRVILKSSYYVREALPGYIFHGTIGSFIKHKTDVQETDLQAHKKPGGTDWGIEPEDQKGLLHTEKDGKIIKEYVPSAKGNYGDYYEGIYNAIRNDADVPVSPEDALNVIKIIEAAYISNAEKKSDRIMRNALLILILLSLKVAAQRPVSKVWVADNDDGTYKNPIINADYSDPDAIRVGDDYYMVSSSFTHIPGLPILHSKDLVNWAIIGHALKKQPPDDVYDKVQHGAGVWAPSIRYHNNEFYIYYPDPDFGIYLLKAKNILGPWNEPLLIEAGKGLIDPCPLWDDNGKSYLVHAYAGSRAGIKSIIVVKEMNKDGTKIISDGVMVYDGHEKDPTIEGPKFYKRNGYYYIFAPAGGVSTGWQLVLRSKNVYGPYERKVVMDQGTTSVNGPHQGAWVTTQTGEDWFLHFQDKDAYGRVVHLQPMKWINDWPVIGIDKDGDGKGEPVLVNKKPNVGKQYPMSTVQDGDEFNATKFGLQWQWQANAKEGWAFPTPNGSLRMFSVYQPDSIRSAWNYPNILAQKFPAEEFTATVKILFKPKFENERFGLIILGTDYASLSVIKKNDGVYIVQSENINADKSKNEIEISGLPVSGNEFYLKVKVSKGGICEFSYQTEKDSGHLLKTFTAKPGRWVGAKVGMFCSRTNITNDAGFADVDWFRIEKVE